MAHYGDMAVAGLGVAMKVNMIVVMLLIGLGTGIQPLLGYCFGAGNRKRYFAVLKFSILLAFVLSAIMTCVCYFGADGLVSAFLEDADAYDFGFQFSRIYILSGPWTVICIYQRNPVHRCRTSFPDFVDQPAGTFILTNLVYHQRNNGFRQTACIGTTGHGLPCNRTCNHPVRDNLQKIFSEEIINRIKKKDAAISCSIFFLMQHPETPSSYLYSLHQYVIQDNCPELPHMPSAYRRYKPSSKAELRCTYRLRKLPHHRYSERYCYGLPYTVVLSEASLPPH